MISLAAISRSRPVLIAGPTASGKSALALEIAERQGGVIVNADALQVWSVWHLLSARPGVAETARAPHALYGHVRPEQDYSVGHWLRELAPLLARGAPRVIIVGGTGLYLTALTEGLAEIPPVPATLRAESAALLAASGTAALIAELARHDPATLAVLDQKNPARVQRAWEVWRATGIGLAAWRARQGPPLLPLEKATPLVVTTDRGLLATRIEKRFETMLARGALDEVRAVLPIWEPGALWARAIGAPELVAHLHGSLSLDEAKARAIIATRQYAKRQRSWLRARMRHWEAIAPI